jgi:uncharacterized protein YodC (DUF2158 family)
MELEKTVSRTFNAFEDFAVGDIVRLRSGGPVMTVDGAGGSRFVCNWFEGLILHTAEFDQASLQKIPTKDPDLSPA